MRIRQSATGWMVIVLTAALLSVTLFSPTQSGVLASPGAAPVSGIISHSGQAAPFDTATPCTLPFVDVAGDPYLTAIQYIYCAGAISGIDDTHFGPTQPATAGVVIHALDVLFPSATPTPTGTPSALDVTRGQVASIIARRLNLPEYTPTTPDFSDVSPTNVFYVAIETLYHAGIMGGYPDGTFRPNNNILRDELCQVLYNAVLYSLGTPPPSITYVPPATDTPMPTDTPAATNTPAGPTPTDCPNPFVDITGNVFYTAIHALFCRSVTSGADQTHFQPAGTSTRAQFAKIVVLAFGIPFYTPTGGTQDFSDVPPTFFAYLYIESAYHYNGGILQGYDEATCRQYGVPYPCYLPNHAITRGQLTKLIVNAANYALFTPNGGVQTFTDVPPSNIFFVSIETAHQHGIINGYPDGTFRVNNSIRRDEMAQVVYEGITLP